MEHLTMELRDVDVETRVAVGVVAPYDETTLMVADPAGERIIRGAFAKSIRQRETKIPLLRNHDRSKILGRSKGFDDGDQLVGRFGINVGPAGDELLEDLTNGYLGGFSVGFLPLVATRAADGTREIREAKLVEVSTVGMPAYEGAGLLAVRNAQDIDALLAPFANPPSVCLDPIPPIGYGPR